ncbi:hypothetical protein E4T56_gene19504 [Termitomyces sp. T112]|nr:hypothetical protein E4T56_gene19504 [Termitomyces sp. T112]
MSQSQPRPGSQPSQDIDSRGEIIMEEDEEEFIILMWSPVEMMSSLGNIYLANRLKSREESHAVQFRNPRPSSWQEHIGIKNSTHGLLYLDILGWVSHRPPRQAREDKTFLQISLTLLHRAKHLPTKINIGRKPCFFPRVRQFPSSIFREPHRYLVQISTVTLNSLRCTQRTFLQVHM